MTNLNFGELLRELGDAVADVVDIQLILAMTGIAEAQAAILPHRLRVAEAGTYLW